MHGGAQGVWLDKSRTQNIAPGGVAVGLLHTRRRYADDLSEDGVLYHYPRTTRLGKDEAEVQATKTAGELGLPVFFITQADLRRSARRVHLGWVESWDDEAKVFLVTFQDEPPGTAFLDADGDHEFSLEGELRGRRQATEAAGGMDVVLGGGASLIRQFLAASLVDEFELHLVPILFGDGARLFDDIRRFPAEQVRVIDAPGVTHVTCRIPDGDA